MARDLVSMKKFCPSIHGNSIRCSSFLKYLPAMAVALGLSGGIAFAQANPAFDTASNYAIPGWSTTPANLGTGFGAWNIVVQNNTAPPYVGTYLDNSSGVVSGGSSWGTYANSGGPPYGQENFIRPFTGGALGNNQAFSISMASDGVGDGNSGPPSSAQGFSLETTPGGGGIGAAELTLEYVGTQANDNMVFEDNSGVTNTTVSIGFSGLHTGITATVTEGLAGAYTIVVTPFGGGPTLFSFSGTTTGPITQADYFNENTTGNGYFNNLSIVNVPEPSTIGLVVIGLLGAVGLRRRKA
jgi:hypothetical protein